MLKNVLLGSVLVTTFFVLGTGTSYAQSGDVSLEEISTTVQRKIEDASDAIEGAIDSVANTTKELTTASDSADVTTQEIKKRIEKAILEEKVHGKDTRRGYFGEITRVTDDTVTVQSFDKTHIIPVDTEGLVISKDDQAIEPGDIVVGNWAIVLGELDDDQVKAQRIIISEESLRPRSQEVFIGTITDISSRSITLIPRGSEDERRYTLSKSVKMEDAEGNEITATELEEDLNCLVVALHGEDDDDLELIAIKALVSIIEAE